MIFSPIQNLRNNAAWEHVPRERDGRTRHREGGKARHREGVMSMLVLFPFAVSVFVSGEWLKSESRRHPERRVREGRVCERAAWADRGERLHAINQHLRNHSGFSVVFSDGCSLVCYNIISHFRCMFQRIDAFPVDLHWNCPMDFQLHVPI